MRPTFGNGSSRSFVTGLRVHVALVAVFQICYAIFRRDWPPVLSWAILAACFFWATFLAWRDEHRKTIGKQRRDILEEVVHVLNNFPEKVDSLGALISVSQSFHREEDVEWVCQQLDEHGHLDPFGVLGVAFEPGFDGKRLKFLDDARIAPVQIYSISDAMSYVSSTWASKNGLTERKI